jgi:hypothetical protein
VRLLTLFWCSWIVPVNPNKFGFLNGQRSIPAAMESAPALIRAEALPVISL